MRLIICLDDRNGMLFGGRRQSRDHAVTERTLALTAGSKLWMDEYSAMLFPDESGVFVDEAFLDRAEKTDFCFVEDKQFLPITDKIEQIVVFKWNRPYPADTWFPLDLAAEPWKLVKTEDFAGNSHDKITMEVYTR